MPKRNIADSSITSWWGPPPHLVDSVDRILRHEGPGPIGYRRP